MKSEETPFVGGPMDGRVLPVLLGPTGHPPKVYRIPVPGPDGSASTVLIYRRVPMVPGKIRFTHRWKYEYDPSGRDDSRLRWPWSKPRPEQPTS
ncbi:hypothetical protein ACFC96_30835 [Streptomyces sp. NPDC055955]|uniref:hypothetical protein n=1 Tax=Streptomyces sp. NPDC055955 TaxID=3345665 RepID=UPI0035D7C148